jgi:REP element-mobilizing transposase RayT
MVSLTFALPLSYDLTMSQLQITDGSWYHVYNRGVNKMTIFHSNKDFDRFLDRLREYKQQYHVEILAWSLMPNHFHLLVRALPPESQQQFQPRLIGSSTEPLNLRSFLHKLQTAYTMYYQKKHEHSGVVFQGRLKAKLVDSDAYLIQLLHYIHNQAQHHQIAKNFEWPYSSLSEYLSFMRHPLAITNPDPDILDIAAYKEMFAEYQEVFEEEFEV